MGCPWPTAHTTPLCTPSSVLTAEGLTYICANNSVWTSLARSCWSAPWPLLGSLGMDISLSAHLGRMDLGKSSSSALQEGVGSFQQRIPEPQVPRAWSGRSFLSLAPLGSLTSLLSPWGGAQPEESLVCPLGQQMGGFYLWRRGLKQLSNPSPGVCDQICDW